jgi:hypothetical protein
LFIYIWTLHLANALAATTFSSLDLKGLQALLVASLGMLLKTSMMVVTVFHNLTRLFTVIKNRCQTAVTKKQKQKIKRSILFCKGDLGRPKNKKL